MKRSNCYYDSNCTKISYFYCKLCQIHFCNYCIFYPRNLKCLKGHFLQPKLVEKNDLICSICDNQNLKCECYYICNECNDINICAYCYDKIKQNISIEYKCDKCNNFLIWRKGLIKKCNKCNLISKCFLFCFFCKDYFCLKCYKNNTNKCGLNHDLIEMNLNHFDNNKTYSFGNLKNNNLYDIIYGYKMLNRSNCDICNRKFCFKYYICIRCLFIKCQGCYNKKE